MSKNTGPQANRPHIDTLTVRESWSGYIVRNAVETRRLGGGERERNAIIAREEFDRLFDWSGR